MGQRQARAAASTRVVTVVKALKGYRKTVTDPYSALSWRTSFLGLSDRNLVATGLPCTRMTATMCGHLNQFDLFRSSPDIVDTSNSYTTDRAFGNET